MRLTTHPLAVATLFSLTVGMLLLIGCTVNQDKLGRLAEELASTAAAEGRERAPTVVAGARDLSSTAAVEMGERAPTVGVEAATAAKEFSRELQNSNACGGAAAVLMVGSLGLAFVRRHAG